MADVSKRLEKAQKYIEKNKLDAAIEEYQAIVQEDPRNAEHLRTIGDLLVRAGRASEAGQYFGQLFDKYFEAKDYRKAEALYRKSLKSPQPPERIAKLAYIVQKTGKPPEALELYRTAAEGFEFAGDSEGALGCYDQIAVLEPENVEVQIHAGELAARLGKNEVACRALLRAGQLTVPSDIDRGLELLDRAYQLAPNDRTVALAYGDAQLQKGHSKEAVTLLERLLEENQQDPAFLSTFGEALLLEEQLARAESIFESFYQVKPDGFEKLFGVADRYLKAGQAEEALRLIETLKMRLFNAKRQKDFTQALENLTEANPQSIPLIEMAARTFNELNQESRYTGTLNKLYEIYAGGGRFDRALDSLERLIDVDPYDFNNQQRLESLRGKIDPQRYSAVASRISQSATVTGQASVYGAGEAAAAQGPAPTDTARMQSVLEDMIVQVEIFLQYALRAKAIEYLDKISVLFPNEGAKNERLQKLYALAQYAPKHRGAGPAPTAAGAPAAPAAAAAAAEALAAEHMAGVSDLAKISEVTHLIYRQGTPKSVLSTAVNEIGKHLKASKCLAALGSKGRPPSVAVEFCAPGTPQSSGPNILKLLGLVHQHEFDASGALALEAATLPGLREIGLEAALAAQLIDKDKQEDAGLIVVQQVDRPRKWRPNEVYFLKAITDQVMIAVNHTRLRTLMKTLAVTEERTGLISRSSYLDCLLAEVQRAKTQGTPLSVVVLEIDRGQILMRQVGEARLNDYIQTVGQAIISSLRQNDIAIKYTTWSLAFVLPDTTAQNAQALAEKLRRTVQAQKMPWDHGPLNLNIGISEAMIRPDYEVVDAVTDVINRVEFSIEEAHKKGSNVVVVK